MMNAGLRTLVRRTLVALAVVAALGAGSLVHSSVGPPSSPRVGGPSVTKKLDPSDLLARGVHGYWHPHAVHRHSDRTGQQ